MNMAGAGLQDRQHTAPDPAAQAAGLMALLGLAYLTDDAPRRVPGRGAGGSGITVIIPARDEGDGLAAALRSLEQQTLRPDRIVVVINNSTDDTADVAVHHAETRGSVRTDVLEMHGANPYRKAGALNCGIRYLMTDGEIPEQISYLLVMDGDTELHPQFLKRAWRVLERDTALGGLSAACLGKPVSGATPWQNLLLLFQRIEYTRFATARLRSNVHTMSGAGSFYRAEALNDLLTGRPDVFEERESNLVEDYETTLALKLRGWRVTSNQGCVAYTDLMPTLQMLLAQRTRWLRGTVDEWRRYGWCRATWLSIVQVTYQLISVAYLAIWLPVAAHVILSGGQAATRYLVVGAFWSVYQGISVRQLGWKVMLFEMAIIPEAMFNVIRNYWLARSVLASYLGSRRAWS